MKKINLDSLRVEKVELHGREKQYFYMQRKLIGELYYYQHTSQELWLDEINVNKEFQDCGIGSYMLKELEKICLAKDYKVIRGLFCPSEKTEEAIQKTRHFYEKNGYDIIKCNNSHWIEKHIDGSEIKN